MVGIRGSFLDAEPASSGDAFVRCRPRLLIVVVNLLVHEATRVYNKRPVGFVDNCTTNSLIRSGNKRNFPANAHESSALVKE